MTCKESSTRGGGEDLKRPLGPDHRYIYDLIKDIYDILIQGITEWSLFHKMYSKLSIDECGSAESTDDLAVVSLITLRSVYSETTFMA